MNHLQLEDYFLTRLKVDFNFHDDVEVREKQVSLDFDYDVLTHQDDPLLRMLTLKVGVSEIAEDGSKVGYQVECEINGQFRIPEDIKEDQREGLLRINGVSILYSTLRGIIGNLSGSFPVGRFCLPTILPQDVVKHIENSKAYAEKDTVKPNQISPRRDGTSGFAQELQPDTEGTEAPKGAN